MPAGYSKRALPDKLGIKPGSSPLLLRPPEGYATTLGVLPPGVRLSRVAARARPRARLPHPQVELTRGIAGWREAIFPAGRWGLLAQEGLEGLDGRDGGRGAQVALQSGLVDVKVCAVDTVWSGLKLVVPLKERPAPARRRRAPPIVRAGKARV
jgi:hypothetical protein